MNTSRLNAADLAAALVRGCEHHGLPWGEEAAIRLLIAQGTWLRRDEFRDHISTEPSRTGPGLTAWVDWDAVAAEPDQSPASNGELAILRLACHLAGHLSEQAGNRWSLADLLLPLDTTNALLVTRAVAMAAIGPTAVGPLK
jgi:hypothetical protein